MRSPRLIAAALLLSLTAAAHAQVMAPNYEECRLWSIFPAGGRQGESVTVELFGGQGGGMNGVRGVIIDGPPGIIVRDVKNASATSVKTTFDIAADAPPGLRSVRVHCERSGLTNMVYFSVGRLLELREKEPNNDDATAEQVMLPIVVNAVVHPDADVDCFRFTAQQGQRITAAVLAYAFDSHGQGKNYGIVDANLSIVDERGRVIAEASDTYGLDPVLEFTAPAAGTFVARVSLEAFEGFPQAVYRLTLGEVPIATSVFPAGGQRGTTVDVELFGPNIAAGTRQKVTIPSDGAMPLQHVLPAASGAADLALPFLRGDLPERIEVEPNNAREQAAPADVGTTINGRILEPGDEDWYRIKLAAKQAITLETVAQRFLRGPLDTLVEVFDATGKKLTENDDGIALDYISMHDFRPMDSRLSFTAPADGEYFIRVSDQAGAAGPRAVYRLTITATEPVFELYQYPDAVPIWGPGTTAAVLVKVVRWDNLNGDVRLRIEGLPTGWTAAETTNRSYESQPRQEPVMYQFLTITAPADAKVGDIATFCIVGQAEVTGRTIERVAQPLTLYYSSDTGYFRITPVARAAVAQPQTPWLATTAKSLTVEPNGIVNIPVMVHNAGKIDKLDLTPDVASGGVATAMQVPQSIAIQNGQAVLPLKLSEQFKVGHYAITVSLRWRSDIRIGMPGPCTQLIDLNVAPGK